MEPGAITQLRRGVIEFCVLALLRDGERYAFELVRTLGEADGLVTRMPGVVLAAFAADCAPILLADPEAGVVAAVHAGWRGTVAGVGRAAVAALEREYGSRPEQLRAGIGPGICGRCYEVGPEFAERFPMDVLAPGKKGKLLLDLVELNRRQLVEAGVDPKRIRALEFCTYESDRLFSHRRNPDGSRFAALVALR
jgi:YfiH family protein